MVGDDLLALELGSFSPGICFDLGFVGEVLVTDLVSLQLIGDSRLTTSQGSGNIPYAVVFVVQELYFIAFGFGEMGVVLS
jgi:hypothetical protein